MSMTGATSCFTLTELWTYGCCCGRCCCCWGRGGGWCCCSTGRGFFMTGAGAGEGEGVRLLPPCCCLDSELSVSPLISRLWATLSTVTSSASCTFISPWYMYCSSSSRCAARMSLRKMTCLSGPNLRKRPWKVLCKKMNVKLKMQ